MIEPSASSLDPNLTDPAAPGYQPPVESTPDRQPQLEQDERLPSSQTTPPGSAPVQDQNRER